MGLEQGYPTDLPAYNITLVMEKKRGHLFLFVCSEEEKI
jgi:hypothetical protein